METLQDKDVFLVKIPNKLKDLLRQPDVFTLDKEERIGVIEQVSKSEAAVNQESDDLSVLQGVRKSFKARCKIEVPIKR